MQPLPNAGVNPDSRVPVFEQIKNLIQFAILTEVYGEGTQLPPVLALAKEIGVNLNTVAKAYRDLEIMGVITTRRGLGCFVKKDAPQLCRKLLIDQIQERLRESLLEAKAAGLSQHELESFVRTCLADGDGPYTVQTNHTVPSVGKRKRNESSRG